MATRRSEAAKEERLARGQYSARDLDVPTALHLFEWSEYRFSRSTEALSLEMIDRVFAALQEAHPMDARVVFVREVMHAPGPAPRQAKWKRAVVALRQFAHSRPLHDKERRQKLLEIARDPVLLSAVQTACVSCAKVPVAFLAVLILDGSEVSVDASFPHVDRARGDPATRDALAVLKPYARGVEAFAPMLYALARPDSRVLALGERLGLAADAEFCVDVRFHGRPRANVTCELQLDSTRAVDFEVKISTGLAAQRSVTAIGPLGLVRDELELGTCTLETLPQWLRHAEQELGLRWNRESARSTTLQGDRLARMLDWLLGGAAPDGA